VPVSAGRHRQQEASRVRWPGKSNRIFPGFTAFKASWPVRVLRLRRHRQDHSFQLPKVFDCNTSACSRRFAFRYVSVLSQGHPYPATTHNRPARPREVKSRTICRRRSWAASFCPSTVSRVGATAEINVATTVATPVKFVPARMCSSKRLQFDKSGCTNRSIHFSAASERTSHLLLPSQGI